VNDRRRKLTVAATDDQIARMKRAGVTHRVPWNQQALSWLKKVS